MEHKPSKLRSLIKQVQSSTEEILTRRSSVSGGPNSPGIVHPNYNRIHASTSSTSSVTGLDNQLDLSSAIEYNHYLINSYLEERNVRELPLYQQIVNQAKQATVPNTNDQQINLVAQCEQTIIEQIRKEFFLESLDEEDSGEDDDSVSYVSDSPNSAKELNYEEEKHSVDALDSVEVPNHSICDFKSDSPLDLPPSPQSINPECENIANRSETADEAVINQSSSPCSPIVPQLTKEFKLNKSKILELCVLANLPELSPFESTTSEPASSMKCDTFLRFLIDEKERLTRQVTIVSKRLSDMIVDNDDKFGTELTRVNQIDLNLKNAINICKTGRRALFQSRDFTLSGLSIVDNYSRREAIVEVIHSLQSIKTIQSTIDHIKSLLEFDKNFPAAIRLYHETSESLERMASNFSCVKEMKSKLVEMLLLAEEQMDGALAKMPTNFCSQTYQQLVNAYKQIDKSDSSIHQLMMHFTNTIHDKAFSIVLGYVELFSDLGTVNSSTPIKVRKTNRTNGSSATTTGNESSASRFAELKRKPFAELCQFLKAESFLSCLTDLCRAMWDVMQNYYRVLSFYRCRERLRCSGLVEHEVHFAVTKLERGVLQVWSDVQHKIRTLVSSVKFVEVTTAGDNERTPTHTQTMTDNQDQLLFSFEEFIKILTVGEKMIEIGDEFCSLYRTGQTDDTLASVTVELQNTLFKQTRAYFQSYHQVSMAELRIFLENETWTRIPVETVDEFSLIASLQEFAFIKNRLLRLRGSTYPNDASVLTTDNNSSNKPKSSPKSSTSSTFLLSPLTTSKHYFAAYFVDRDELDGDQDEEDGEGSPDSIGSPFDDLHSMVINHQMYDDPELHAEDEVIEANPTEGHKGPEIATTNTALNVVRLTGRYMHIMFLLRPISHDVIKALMELFDYYFFTVYRFFAVDSLNTGWLSTCILGIHQATATANLSLSSVPQHSTVSSTTQNHFTQISSELRSFIRRINDTLILNDSSVVNTSLNTSASMSNLHHHQPTSPLPTQASDPLPNSQSTPNVSPKRVVKYPPPMLPDYVPVDQCSNLYALPERIMAIESLIFISRQFYNLCPFLLDILRTDSTQPPNTAGGDSSLSQERQQQSEDGFKLLQFYHDEMCFSVESLIFQCLFAVSTKLLPYETIIVGMAATKWDLKEIPSIHSKYVDQFVAEIRAFNDRYLELLELYDVAFLIPNANRGLNTTTKLNNVSTTNCTESSEDECSTTPLIRLEQLSGRINELLWECIVRISNRCLVEGFASARKCTNEGRALMQLDYQQFLLNLERLITLYFEDSGQRNTTAKTLLATEKEIVEEYVKAYYLTEPIFVDWIRQRDQYTGKQVLSLVNCLAGDNRKLRSSLLAAVDATTNAGDTTAANMSINTANQSNTSVTSLN